VQQGAATSYLNTQSRVRAVAALTNGGTVSGTLNGQTLLTGAISPLIGSYVTVNATSASTPTTMSLAVNGANVSFTVPTLGAGKDTTLMVWGDPAAPKLAVLNDDNRLPTVSGNVKVRLINAIPSQTAGVSLNIDYTARASNVTPGTASTPASIASTSSSQVDVTVPTLSSPIYTKSDLAFASNSVWSFIAVPNTTTAVTDTYPVAGMQALPKRER